MVDRHVGIVGAGLIGRSWAVAFARAGHVVRMYDPVDGAARASYGMLPEMLAGLAERGLLRGEMPEAVFGRITIADALEHAVAGAFYVQESGPENRETKASIFAEMDRFAADDVVLASSTSIILPSLFTGQIAHKGNCLVAHPLNPPHLIPAIELVPAPWTDPAILQKAKDIHIAIGQKPVVMMKEIDGFLMNRLQGALLEECFRLLEEGYASVEDIDTGIRDGLAMRWSIIGPFETMDLNAPGGIRDYVTRFNGGYEKILEKAKWRASWTGESLDRAEAARAAVLPRSEIKKRQDWRDQQLMDLATFRARATKS